jgi:hypothetical protein
MNGFTKPISLIAIVVAAMTIVSATHAASGKSAGAIASSRRASVLNNVSAATRTVPRPPRATTHGKGRSVDAFLRHRRHFDGAYNRPGTAGLARCNHSQNVLEVYLPGAMNGWGGTSPVAGFAASQLVIVRATSYLPNGSGGWRADSLVDWSSSSNPYAGGFNGWRIWGGVYGWQFFPYTNYAPFPLRGSSTAIVVYEFWWIDQGNPNRWLYDYDLPHQCQQAV